MKAGVKLVSCLAYSSTLKMEATCSSETSVDFQQATLHYIPEDRTLHTHLCENLKSYEDSSVLSVSTRCVSVEAILPLHVAGMELNFICLPDVAIYVSVFGRVVEKRGD
jgi:hypothetical protein